MTKHTDKPELLAPAGNLEKLQIAFKYGADACYVGGTVFGLRKFADNFDEADLQHAVNIANEQGKHVYQVLNGFAHDSDIESLKPHLDILETIKPHAFIVSDLGVMTLVKERTSIPIHVSTQASTCNAYTCELWKDIGAKRVVLGRETSIEDCKRIKNMLDIELEVFIHGAMCASYSGKCVISNYTSGRDSNRGGCVQSCRHEYDIMDNDTKNIDYTSHIMNAKDLQALQVIPQMINAGIDSFKIEGRMKSNMYVANTVSVYRDVIDQHMSNENIDFKMAAERLRKVSNREFSTGGLEEMPFGSSINYDFDDYDKTTEYIGTIQATDPENGTIFEVKHNFKHGQTLEILFQNGTHSTITIDAIHNMAGDSIERATQNSLVKVPYIRHSQVHDIIRLPLL